MSVNGKHTDAQVLCWPGRVLSEEDVRRYLTSQAEVLLAPGTVVTPLALDRLKQARVRIRRDAVTNESNARNSWSIAQEKPYPLVQAALGQLAREGLSFVAVTVDGEFAECVRKLAQAVARREWHGSVIFCSDAALAACIANKSSGIRAAVPATPAQAKRVRETLSANVVAVEMPGRTMFEICQIVREATRGGACPENVAKILTELDGHAHR
jgi:ribose 5-phosphate isomerase RpiB